MRKDDKGFVKGLIAIALLISNRMLLRKIYLYQVIYLRNMILLGKAAKGRIWPLLKLPSKA